jgi:hypothetical protein
MTWSNSEILKGQIKAVPFLTKNGKYIFVDSVNLNPLSNRNEYDSVTESDCRPDIWDTNKYEKSRRAIYRHPYNDSLSFKVYKDNNEGIVDSFGNEIIPPIYDKVWYRSAKEMTTVYLNGKLGVINVEGILIIPTIYEDVTDFQESLCAVKLNGKWGFCDYNGILVFPPIYDFIWFSEGGNFNDNGGNRKVKMNGKWGLIGNGGELYIPPKYDEISSWTIGSKKFFKVKINTKEGILNYDGAEVLPPIYDKIISYLPRIAIKIDGKYGFLDEAFREVISPIYDDTGYFETEEGFLKVKLSENWGIIDKMGNEILPFEYIELGTVFSEGLLRFSKLGYEARWDVNTEKWGYMDKELNVVIPPSFNHCGEFYNGFAYVHGEDGEIRIDKTGKIIIEDKDLEDYFYWNDKMKEWSYGKWGLYSENENEIKVELDGKWGTVNKEGSQVIPIIYEDLILFDKFSAVK